MQEKVTLGRLGWCSKKVGQAFCTMIIVYRVKRWTRDQPKEVPWYGVNETIKTSRLGLDAKHSNGKMAAE